MLRANEEPPAKIAGARRAWRAPQRECAVPDAPCRASTCATDPEHCAELAGDAAASATALGRRRHLPTLAGTWHRGPDRIYPGAHWHLAAPARLGHLQPQHASREVDSVLIRASGARNAWSWRTRSGRESSGARVDSPHHEPATERAATLEPNAGSGVRRRGQNAPEMIASTNESRGRSVAEQLIHKQLQVPTDSTQHDATPGNQTQQP